MKTREELKAILDEWIPKYIRQVVELRSGSRLSAERYNELMNLLITQGDDTIELAETVKQYMELLVEDMTAEFEETTEAVTGLANNAVSTANSAVTSVNNYKTIMDSNMQQFKTSVNNTVTNMSADIAAFKESVSQSIAASDVKVNTAVATANKLTADMEAYRVELNQLTEQTFTEMQNALSTQVSADVISGVAALKAELLKDINTTITALEEQVMTIANTAEQSVNSAIQDIEAYKSGMDVRLDDALAEVEESLSVAGEVIRDAAEIYARLDELSALVNSFDTRINAVEAGDAKTLDGHDAEYFAPKADLANYIKSDGSNGFVNEVSDLNSFYTGITLTKTALNTPVEDEWWLIVAGGTVGTTVQTAYGLYGRVTPKQRYCAGGTWSEWFDLNKGYLPLTGGKLNSGTYNPLNLENLSSDEIKIRFSGQSGNLGYLGMTGKGKLVVVSSEDWKDRDILHTGNMADHVLPKTGGHIKADTYEPLIIENTANGTREVYVQFRVGGAVVGQLGVNTDGNPIFYSADGNGVRDILHVGNMASHVTPSAIGASATGHKHTKSEITDFPTSLPASDVSSWAKASAKPTYTWNEITSKPTSFTPATHNQAASTITAGTFAGQVVAPAGTDYTTNRIRNSVFTTTDPGAGASVSYANGSTIDVYE